MLLILQIESCDGKEGEVRRALHLIFRLKVHNVEAKGIQGY